MLEKMPLHVPARRYPGEDRATWLASGASIEQPSAKQIRQSTALLWGSSKRFSQANLPSEEAELALRTPATRHENGAQVTADTEVEIAGGESLSQFLCPKKEGGRKEARR